MLITFTNPGDKDKFAELIGEKIQPWCQSLLYPKGRKSLADLMRQNITEKTASIWYPKAELDIVRNLRWAGEWEHPKYPIYIVSKTRWETPITARHLEDMNIDYHIIVEEHQFDNYNSIGLKGKILILPKKYQQEYQTFDDLRDTKSKGPGAARNFAWDHALSLGSERHWVMDDNIFGFYRFNKNRQIKVINRGAIRCMEDFIDRYTNIDMAGPNYFMFVPRKNNVPPFILNTRIYSCNLIRNSSIHRWRGRYNEDTDLSLMMLKSGGSTVQFNNILQHKAPTQTVKGGCDADFYAVEGTKNKSQMLADMHPDVAKVVEKFSRIHHEVDYSQW